MSNDPAPSSDELWADRPDGTDQKTAGLAGDLRDLGAAMRRVAGETTANRSPAADARAAVERIQDIAFALRECAVDAALCDALEAAAREVAEAVARGEAAGQRLQAGFKLLGVLTDRVEAIIASAAPAGGPLVRITATEDAAIAANPPAAEVDDAARPPAIPRRAASESLAALRALSAEELIALFS
jgi:hypothetical protein